VDADIEGRCLNLIEALIRNWRGGIEVNHEILRKASVPVEVRTENLPNTTVLWKI
jgi:hypothetical protein